MTKQFTQAKRNDRFVLQGLVPFEFSTRKFKDSVDIPDKIHIIPIGEWMHDAYGPMIINNADIREFAQNFNAGIRKGVFITAGHEGWDELPAVGWFREVEVRDDGLWGTVEWNDKGIEALSDKQWKFFSPELCRDYEDPETHNLYRNVLTGGALTKSPYFKELQAIVFSDKNIKSNNLNNKQSMSKTLEEVLALDASALTDEDKAVLKENADKLTEEQKVTYADAIKEEAPAETAEEKTAREAKEQEDANIAAGLNADGSTKEGGEQAMSEKNGMVTMPKALFSALEQKANQGAEAFKELEKQNLNTEIAKLSFSSTNKVGFLPKQVPALRAFMENLNKEQRTAFSALITSMPKSGIFNEAGEAKDVTAGSIEEVNTLVDTKMKANPKMKYSDALKAVFGENKGLEQRYNDSLPDAKNTK